MIQYTFEQIIAIARDGSESQWMNVVNFLEHYHGADDDLLGLKQYLENNNYNKMLLLSFRSEVSRMPFGKRRPLFKVPAWALVAAASIALAGGLYLNDSVQKKSLHLIEAPLPVYLSDQDMLFNKAMSLYKKADYEKASGLFRQLSSDTAIYYSGVCYEVLRYFEMSQAAFNRITPGSEFYNKARIRLAAIAADEGETSKALLLLKTLKPANQDEAHRIKSIKSRLK